MWNVNHPGIKVHGGHHRVWLAWLSLDLLLFNKQKCIACIKTRQVFRPARRSLKASWIKIYYPTIMKIKLCCLCMSLKDNECTLHSWPLNRSLLVALTITCNPPCADHSPASNLALLRRNIKKWWDLHNLCWDGKAVALAASVNEWILDYESIASWNCIWPGKEIERKHSSFLNKEPRIDRSSTQVSTDTGCLPIQS